MSRIPCYMDLHPGRNVYLTSWFILSVLFLKSGETSVVIRRVWDPPSHDLHPGRNISPTSWFILSVLFLTGGETFVVLHMSRIPCYMDLHPGRNVYLTNWFILSVLFLTRGETFVVPVTVQGSPITQTSTLVGMSSLPAGSFCLCCF